jgi:predicted dehydrogenase
MNKDKKIKLGIVGLGERGYSLIKTIFCCEDADITAVCDIYRDRVDAAADKVRELFGNEPEKYTDYKELLKSENVDAVFVPSAWESHIEIAIASMKAGKYTARYSMQLLSMSSSSFYRTVRAYEGRKM